VYPRFACLLVFTLLDLAMIDLKKYKALSFDIYATLIDWETGIIDALQPLIRRVKEQSEAVSRRALLQSYTRHEHAFELANPQLLYPNLLSLVYKQLAIDLAVPFTENEANIFGESIGNWPAFPDTVAAMKVLAQHYSLIVLSNVDAASFSKTLSGPLSGVTFSAIYTAEEIGSYKPDLKNFAYMIDHAKSELGVEKNEILHTAQSLSFDHVPAKRIGLAPGVYIKRESEMGRTLESFEEGEIELGAAFESLGKMAEEVERAFEG